MLEWSSIHLYVGYWRIFGIMICKTLNFFHVLWPDILYSKTRWVYPPETGRRENTVLGSRTGITKSWIFHYGACIETCGMIILYQDKRGCGLPILLLRYSTFSFSPADREGLFLTGQRIFCTLSRATTFCVTAIMSKYNEKSVFNSTSYFDISRNIYR